MNLMLSHSRCQRAVGHGFFHTAQVSVGGGTFRYVYDCGGKGIAHRIDEFLGEDDGNKVIDALFLSHFHADHVGGLDRLLARAEVDTVIIPYLSFEERLLLVLDSIDGPNSSTTLWDFLGDPAGWLRNRGAQRVIQIRGYRPDDPADNRPPPEFPPLPNLRERSNDLTNASGVTLKMGLVPDLSAFEAGDPDEESEAVSAHVQVVEHTQGLRLSSGCAIWYFLTFVEHPSEKKLKTFYRNIRQLLSASDRKKLHKGREKATWTRLIGDSSFRKRLKEAYAGVFTDFNRTSLCLYSGRGPQKSHVYWRRRWLIHEDASSPRHAWLGTGDAVLKDVSVREAFFQHFGGFLPSVHTLTLPHHGSAENYHPDLVRKAQPLVVVVATRSNSKKHPGRAVLDDLQLTPTWYRAVTAKSETEYRDVFGFAS